MSAPPATAGSKERGRIEVNQLSKSFKTFRAVDDLSFSVDPGRITGFLGPNGAGKTTTLRMILGLIRPTSGSSTIGGVPYVDLANPLGTVGAALEATNFHPGRTGRDHLRVLCTSAGLPDSRADQLLELVGIPAAAKKRAGGYSMGMRQRLGLAGALLGDPDILILDEPANGLDPEGIRWLRGFLRHLAGEGKTILVSSHLLSEVEQTVDDVIILANGRLIRQGTIEELRGEPKVRVRTPDAGQLAQALQGAGIKAEPGDESGVVVAVSDDPARVGDLAYEARVRVHELTRQKADLEHLFFQLTSQGDARNRNLGAQSDQHHQPGGGGAPQAQQAPIEGGR
ncbi:ABC transporter ATP-binding protein [Yimella sp. cx-51]|uniref:ABC transporter ATP-binding protein n=1 Tax=Yimella sp. cx-51 TaxID=2770551 RepID=UPI001FCBF457|nr:ABC transporter ATP-binding protein [Yimella sp. cx-51]